MNSPLFQRSSIWVLTLGVAIGGLSFAGFHSAPGVPKAFAAGGSGSIAPETARDMLRAMDSSLANLAQAVEPAVVHIEVGSNSNEGGMGGVKGEGSGVIYRPDGYIITNDHVVNGMDTVKVILTDGRKFNGTVTRSDEAGDIAIVKIDAKDLPTIPLGDSSKVRPGITAMAVGSPFGLDNTITIGHVSALDRSQLIGDTRFPAGQRFYADLIQTDAAINMGNSGGALVDIDGHLIGINTAIASSTGGSNGIGFAVPSNQARLIADMLIKDGKVTRAFLGLQPVALKDVQKKDLGVESGAYVSHVEPKTPADLAGIKEGDVVTKIQDTTIESYMDLRNAMYQYKPGTTVHIEYVRDHQTKGADVKLESVPKPKIAPQATPTPGNPFLNNPFKSSPFGNDPFGGDSSPFGQPNTGTPRRTGAAHFGAMVTPVTNDLRAQFHIPADQSGAIVVSTEQGSVAEMVGLLSGDLITSFNGSTVKSADDLVNALHGIKWGDNVSISFSRWSPGGTITTVTKKFAFK